VIVALEQRFARPDTVPAIGQNRKGTSCDDGNTCTTADQCNASGVCIGSDRVGSDPTCSADLCYEQATCNPGNGICQVATTPSGAQWSGFLQPINQDGSSVFKLGRTIPVKFQLSGQCSESHLIAKIYVAQVSQMVTGSEMEASSTSAADQGNTFRYDSAANKYIFNLSTKPMSSGTWQIRADLGDGVTNRTVRVSLQK
jgi:hypothetical protein